MWCLRPGLEPTAHPQAGRPREVGASKLFAVNILKLAPGLGIEPRLTESKSVVLPLHNSGIEINRIDLT